MRGGPVRRLRCAGPGRTRGRRGPGARPGCPASGRSAGRVVATPGRAPRVRPGGRAPPDRPPGAAPAPGPPVRLIGIADSIAATAASARPDRVSAFASWRTDRTRSTGSSISSRRGVEVVDRRPPAEPVLRDAELEVHLAALPAGRRLGQRPTEPGRRAPRGAPVEVIGRHPPQERDPRSVADRLGPARAAPPPARRRPPPRRGSPPPARAFDAPSRPESRVHRFPDDRVGELQPAAVARIARAPTSTSTTSAPPPTARPASCAASAEPGPVPEHRDRPDQRGGGGCAPRRCAAARASATAAGPTSSHLPRPGGVGSDLAFAHLPQQRLEVERVPAGRPRHAAANSGGHPLAEPGRAHLGRWRRCSAAAAAAPVVSGASASRASSAVAPSPVRRATSSTTRRPSTRGAR